MSDLMKISRAIQDSRFQWRVGAAMILQAQTEYTSTDPQRKTFALHTISNPSSVDTSMLALVASDADVVAAVTLTDDIVPDTDAVDDADIRRVVAAMWGPVSKKYAPANSNANPAVQ